MPETGRSCGAGDGADVAVPARYVAHVRSDARIAQDETAVDRCQSHGLAPKQEMQPADFEKGVSAKIAQRIAFRAGSFHADRQRYSGGQAEGPRRRRSRFMRWRSNWFPKPKARSRRRRKKSHSACLKSEKELISCSDSAAHEPVTPPAPAVPTKAAAPLPPESRPNGLPAPAKKSGEDLAADAQRSQLACAGSAGKLRTSWRLTKEKIYDLLMEQIDIATSSRLPRDELKRQIIELIGEIVIEQKLPLDAGRAADAGEPDRRRHAGLRAAGAAAAR